MNGSTPSAEGTAPVYNGEHLTDLGNARRLVALHGTGLRFCYDWHLWLAHDGLRWVVGDTPATLRRAKDAVASIYIEAGHASDPAARKALADHAKRSEAEARIKAMISLAESEPGVPMPIRSGCEHFIRELEYGTKGESEVLLFAPLSGEVDPADFAAVSGVEDESI